MTPALCSYPPHACMDFKVELTPRFRRFCLCLILSTLVAIPHVAMALLVSIIQDDATLPHIVDDMSATPKT